MRANECKVKSFKQSERKEIWGTGLEMRGWVGTGLRQAGERYVCHWIALWEEPGIYPWVTPFGGTRKSKVDR